MKHSYSEQDLRDAVAQSTTLAQVLRHLEIVAAGGNYQTTWKRIKQLGIDTSHFTGMGVNKGKKFGPKRPLSDYLKNLATINSHKLRLRLLQERIFPHRCNSCQLEHWLGTPIPLELHHRDGNHQNNNLINLELLCPNCHAFTDNYRGKGKD